MILLHLPVSPNCLMAPLLTQNHCTTARIFPSTLDIHLESVRIHPCLDKSLYRIHTNRLPPLSEFPDYLNPPFGFQHHLPVNKCCLNSKLPVSASPLGSFRELARYLAVTATGQTCASASLVTRVSQRKLCLYSSMVSDREHPDLLTYCCAVWVTRCIEENRRNLQEVVKAAECVIGITLLSTNNRHCCGPTPKESQQHFKGPHSPCTSSVFSPAFWEKTQNNKNKT